MYYTNSWKEKQPMFLPEAEVPVKLLGGRGLSSGKGLISIPSLENQL